jgi:hypothetical protein
MRTLAPDRDRPTRADGLVDALERSGTPASIVVAAASGLGRLEAAIREAFPENLFCDLDALLAGIVREAVGASAPAEHVAGSFDRAVEIQHLFGRATPIRFRYVHDFVYGFDWARWVRKDPAGRARVGPYDRAFLDRMRARGAELLELIEQDDSEYPRLPGREPRNPFGFSRQPDAESRLFTDLARRDLLPVAAWRFDATPRWDRPFRELRAERARELGI